MIDPQEESNATNEDLSSGKTNSINIDGLHDKSQILLSDGSTRRNNLEILHYNTSLENSYIVLSSDSLLANVIMDNNGESVAIADQDEANVITSSQKSDASSASGSGKSISQEKLRKSGSLMSRFNSNAKHDRNNSTNLPSTLASAFSSLSSFTSNFTFNGSQSNNNIASNNHSNRRDSSVNLSIETASTSTRLSQLSETRDEIFHRKVALERKNLINLTKLIVKDLISSSLSRGRTIENDCQSAIHLNNYFTLVDRVLKHGLKQNLLSNRSTNLWSTLDSLKYLKESTLMSESIRSLAHTKTPDGKIRAWIRLAMMQKKLPEYFNELLAQKDILLKEIYHEYAFMLNDESHVFAGLIIGVNVIDCNFFVKDDNFDLMDEIIDLVPYLKSANSFEEANESDYNEPEPSAELKDEQLKSLAKVLDQKNYLEERNKHLDSTITNLQSRIQSLEEQNSRLEMEAKVSEVRIAKLREKRNDASSDKGPTSNSTLPIPDAIKSMINRNKSSTNLSENQYSSNMSSVEALVQDMNTTQSQASTQRPGSNIISATSSGISANSENLNILSNDDATSSKQHQSSNQRPNDSILLELESLKVKNAEQVQELTGLRERIGILETSYRGSLDKIRILERDLDIQTSMNSDKETTIKMYEKDIREKQQQVESLRASLADCKKLNSDLSDRFADTSAKLKDRLKSVTQLQTSLDKWKLENKTLASRLQDKQTEYISLSQELEKSLAQIKELKKYNEKINDELRKERECGQSCSVTVEEQNSKITELNEKLERFEKELIDLGPYRDQYETLKRRCQEYEQSLEEVGAQLRESSLEVENLKENSSVFLDSQWMDSKQVKECALCHQLFSVTRRKHHCRLCGNVFCQSCSDNKMELASSAKPARVCDTCHAFLLAKFVKSATSTQPATS